MPKGYVAALMAAGLMVAGLAAVSSTALAAPEDSLQPAPPKPDRPYRPVTDAMLQHPDAGEWLSWRRTLDSWGYSPLDQINTFNVRGLSLVWARTLNRGSYEGTPLVHDGVMYIEESSDTIEAVDAATGASLRTRAPSMVR